MPATIQTIHKPTRARGLDTSGNNNHAQIYSGRALEFDGVTDYLNVGTSAGQIFIDYSEETTAVNRAWTVAVWLNYDAAGSSNQSITGFDNSGDVSTSNYLRLSNTETLGFYDIGGNASRTGDTVLKPKTWYRAVFVYNGSDTVNFYLNGVADGSGTLTSSNANNNADLNISYIGGAFQSSVFGSAFAGKMSDFQAWQGAWTADDAMYDYLNPEQLALNRGGTSLTNSNLKLWYLMNEGHRGNQSYVLDASNTGIGDDITVNGDFATGDLTGWTTGSGGSNGIVSYSNGGIRIQSGGDNAYFRLHDIYGIPHKLVYDVIDNSSTSNRLQIEHSSGSINLPGTSVGDELGTYTYYFNSDKGAGQYTAIKRSGSGVDVTLDNIKLYPINNKHNATTVFYGDEQITEQVNRDFSGSGNWSNYGSSSTAPSISGGKLVCVTDGDGGNEGAQLSLGRVDGTGSAYPILAGRTYRMSAKLDNTAGKTTPDINFSLGGSHVNVTATDGSPSDGTINTTEQEYYADITATDDSTAVLIYQASADNDASTTFTIDDVSIKEIGVAMGWTDADQQLDIPQTALQSYNQLAWNYQLDDSTNPIKSSVTPAFGTDDFAVSFSFFTNEMINQKFMYQAPSGTDGRFIFYTTGSGNIKIYSDSGGVAVGYQAITDDILTAGKWFHIIAIWNRTAGTVTSYVNGQLQSASSDISGISGGFNGGGEFHPFRYSSAIQFVGSLTDIAYWKNTTFSASDASELYNEGLILDAREHSKSSTLINYWKNDGLSDWKDLVGSDDLASNNMTETMLITAGVDSSRDSQGFLMNRQRLTNSINGLNTGSSGDVSTVYDSGVVVQDSSTLDITGAFTIGCWFKMKDFDQSYNLVQKKTTWNGAGYGIYIHGTNKKPYLEWAPSSGYQQFGGDTNMVDTIDVWYFLHAVHDPDGLHNSSTGIDSLYVAKTTDTSLTTKTTTSAGGGASIDDPVATNDFPLVIGQHTGGGHNSSSAIHFTGEIDDVVVYNGALSPEQVLRNFKAGKRSHK